MSTENRANTDHKFATAMMIYMSAQNELATKARENIAAIRENTALDQMCLYIVEDTYDDTPDPSTARTTIHYELPPSAVDGHFVKPPLFPGINKAVTNPGVFNKFLIRANTHFTSFGQNETNQKILILWGHGGGMVMLDEDKEKGNSRARASIAEFAEVLERQKELEFDIIAFDSCYMGVIEVMNQFREATKFALVSSTVVAADGYPYKKFIGDLKTGGPDLQPETAAALIAACYDEHYKLLLPNEERYLFVCDMKEIEKCADALNKLGEELSKLLGEDEQNDPLRDAVDEALIAAHAESAYVPVLIFLRKLASRLQFRPDQNKLKDLYEAMDKLALAVKASFRGQLSDGGYTPTSPLIWSPENRGMFLRSHQAYNQLDSSMNGTGGWTKMWRKFHAIPDVLNIETAIPGKFTLGLPPSVLFNLM